MRPRPLELDTLRAASRGFTLIELLVVMTMAAILAAIATPAYFDAVRRGQRASAQASMLDLAARQRQWVIDRRAYATTPTELGAVLPASVLARYAVTIEAPADAVPPVFRIVAVPQGPQSDDRCGTLSVDDAGRRSPEGCW